MIKKNWFRLTLGTILGGFAGLSLTTSVLPLSLSLATGAESFFVRWTLGEYAAHSALIWAVGGWAVGKVGFPKAGALILALVGLASSLILCGIALGTDVKILVTAGLAGTFYGFIGGLLLGTVLQKPAAEEDVPTAGKE